MVIRYLRSQNFGWEGIVAFIVAAATASAAAARLFVFAFIYLFIYFYFVTHVCADGKKHLWCPYFTW